MCTPGRLVDHINHTDGFTLERLRFLVVDEADRLLGQAYYNWLDKILNNAYNSTSSAASQNRFVKKYQVYKKVKHAVSCEMKGMWLTFKNCKLDLSMKDWA